MAKTLKHVLVGSVLQERLDEKQMTQIEFAHLEDGTAIMAPKYLSRLIHQKQPIGERYARKILAACRYHGIDASGLIEPAKKPGSGEIGGAKGK